MAGKKGIRFQKPKAGEFIIRDGWWMPTKPCAKGHLAPRNKKGACVQCVREYRASKGHYARTPAAIRWRAENQEHLYLRHKEYFALYPKRRLVNSARRASKIKHLPFDLSYDDFEIPAACPILGIALSPGVVLRTDASPSLDRIVPERGYVKGNVIVISWRANRLKQDATLDEMRKLVEFYARLISP
jgi:hypothetical protein